VHLARPCSNSWQIRQGQTSAKLQCEFSIALDSHVKVFQLHLQHWGILRKTSNGSNKAVCLPRKAGKGWVLLLHCLSSFIPS
jgi:hypothetical protein